MPATATKLAKSTPGPWTVHGDNKTLIGCDDRKMMLAEVLWEHVCTEWGRPIEEAQANARLIAAAPKLLANAQQLHMHVNGLHCTMRAANGDYRASALCAAMDDLIRTNAEALASLPAELKGGA